MPTIQQQLNQLKDDKATLNTMLNTMGVETTGSETFTELAPLVGKIVTDPILQDKTIEIKENGTTNIVADEGYDGLNKIEVITNVPTGGGTVVEPDYITDGLVAWFDGEDTTDENNYWNSRVGDDYIYNFDNKLGTKTTNPFVMSKNSNEATNNFVYALGTAKDYYYQGYTIEVVGRVTSKYNVNGDTGGWLIASNNVSAFGIGLTGDDGKITFLNDTDRTDEKIHTGYYNKTFGASLYLKAIGERGASTKYDLLCSVNGENWYSVKETANSTKTGTRNWLSVMCYYAVPNPNTGSSNTYAINGGINCIRIYNRQLTNEELAYNHSIDKARFNLDE